MKIAHSLPIIIVGGALITAAAVGVTSYRKAAVELSETSAKTLIALRESRAAELKRYLKAIQGDLELIASNQQVKGALTEFSSAFAAFGSARKRTENLLKLSYNVSNPAGDPKRVGNTRMRILSNYHKIHNKYDPWFQLLQKVRGYYDIFLLNTNGDVVYSVTKEADFATNLFAGEWRNSGLAKTLDGALSDPPNFQRQFVDFAPYEPSNGAPASFISAPVLNGDEVLGVLAFQMPIKKINEVMQVTSGMGKSGETYIAGEDLLMRTDSRFSETSTILKTKIDTLTAKAAIEGKQGVQETLDYRNIPVFSAYGPMDFAGTRWAVLSEIDTSEIFEPIWQMRNFMLGIGILVAGIIAGAGLLFARSVTGPLSRLNTALQVFGKDKHLADVPNTDRTDEIGDMARSFEALSKNLDTYMTEVADKNQILESLSAKLSKYLSPQIYESIFSGKRDASVTTERKKLTVFFSDIKDFTQTTEDLQAEDLTYLLNNYFSEMSVIALEFGATIDKFIGDAMLMFFGDPETLGVKDDAVACVKMAMAMQRKMIELQARWKQKGYDKPFQMRIGINTGFCNVGNFGSSERVDYTIIGGEVNLAARLESVAPPDGIVLSYESYALVNDVVAADKGEPIQVKGIRREVVPYTVSGMLDELAGDQRVIRRDEQGISFFINFDEIDATTRQQTTEALESIVARLKSGD